MSLNRSCAVTVSSTSGSDYGYESSLSSALETRDVAEVEGPGWCGSQ